MVYSKSRIRIMAVPDSEQIKPLAACKYTAKRTKAGAGSLATFQGIGTQRPTVQVQYRV